MRCSLTLNTWKKNFSDSWLSENSESAFFLTNPDVAKIKAARSSSITAPVCAKIKWKR